MPAKKQNALSRLILSSKLIALIGLSVFCFASALGSNHSPSLPRGVWSSAQDADFALKDGDRVVFYGDSITEQRLYTTYVEHYAASHYPNRRITFINTGWGGDKVSGNECAPCAGVGGLSRIKRDVIDHKPTVVTILFGMNDGRYRDFDEATLKVYEDGLSAIIREIKTKTKARIYVITPTVYDGTRHTSWSHTDRYNETLDRYSEAAKRIAQRENLPVIDLHTVTTEALMRAKKQDAAYTFLNDGVHPEPDGQLVMAAEILRAFGARAKGEEITRQASVEANKPASFSVSAPLPWPVPLPSETLRAARPEIMEMGRVNLRVAGLAAGKYRVEIDGDDAGEHTADELASGIALGALSKKASDQSMAVAGLIRKRADLFFSRWRQIELPYSAEYKTTTSAVSGLDSLIAEMADRARAMAATHNYQVTISLAPH